MSPHDRYTRCERLSPRCHLKRPVRPRRHQTRPCTRITRRRRPYRHRGECLNNSAGWIGGPEPALNQATMNARSGAHCMRKLRTVLWGLSGKPVDDAALEEVARLREALRGDLGKQLCGHVTGREVDALHTRTVALLDNPVMSIPDRRPIPWPRSDAYVSLTAAKISKSSISQLRRAVPTGCPCTPTRQSEISDSPAASPPIPRHRFPRRRCGSPRSDRAPIVPAIGSIQWPRPGASSRLLRGPAHR